MTKKRKVRVTWHITELEYQKLKEAAESFGYARVDAFIRASVSLYLGWPKSAEEKYSWNRSEVPTLFRQRETLAKLRRMDSRSGSVGGSSRTLYPSDGGDNEQGP